MKISKCKVALLFAALSLFSTLYAQNNSSNYSEADLVWQEDFNGKKINLKDWNFEFHQPGWVNNEWQSYDDSSKNTYLKDGCLVIQPLKSKNKDGSYSYTSGRINTQGKHTFTYGRFEARLKVPKGQGYLPAFWMMPDDESFYGQWPKCGEIDIMEVLGHETDTLYGTLHFGEPHSSRQGSYTLESGNFADSFHDFAVEWEPGEIRFYCDGVNYKTVNDWYTRRPGFEEVTFPAPFDQPFYLILNVAVGGDWPGNPDASTSFGPEAQMLVDWVKVYQKKEYNEDVEKPVQASVEEIVDSTGNMVRKGDSEWSLLTFQGGQASLKVSDNSLDIIPTADGSVSHAVQVVQEKITLTKGNIYRYSFDAYADENRTMIACISAPNRGWIRYLQDTSVNLTNKSQHFSYEITMTEASDSDARIEFNCGNQNSLAALHISNIRLEKIGSFDLAKAGLNLLPDGNLIGNGQFQEGKGRLAKWKIENKINAEVKVTNDKGRRELMVAASGKNVKSDDVKIQQEEIYLSQGKQYIISFDAYSSKKGQIVLNFAGLTQIASLTKNKQNYQFLYTAPKTDFYTFELELANPDVSVFVDNIFVKENSNLINGSFNSGKAAWELYAHQNAQSSFEIIEEDSNKVALLTVNKTGDMDWMIQLKQNNITLEKGKKYHVSLKVKSDLDRTIMWALQRDGSKDDNWIPYSNTQKIKISDQYKTFEHTFTMASPSDDSVIFTISVGAVDNKMINSSHKIYIDDIVVEEVSN
ncbi:MAG: carbohydrate binding domain-containing protein [Treponema sp.]|nr:carbohydrate binding domain-containing protein [Treponema sp.]